MRRGKGCYLSIVENEGTIVERRSDNLEVRKHRRIMHGPG